MSKPQYARRTTPVIVAALVLLGACGGGEESTPVAQDAASETTVPTLYWLDIWSNSVYRATGPDFTDDEVIAFPTDTLPDGVAADVDGGKLYWTNMGDAYGAGGGTLQRANLDGTSVERIVPAGVTQTPKQMQVDSVNGHVYWSDREGATLWRAGLDGASPEPLVTGHGIQQLVGVALDIPSGKVYFSDRNARKIFRTNLEMPPGQTHADRTDVELLFAFADPAMPIDLDIDRERRLLYWTDSGRDTVHRAPLDIPAGQAPETRADVETLVTGLSDPTGIALDVPNGKMYYGQYLGGAITEAALDGTSPREIGRSPGPTGLALVHVPSP